MLDREEATSRSSWSLPARYITVVVALAALVWLVFYARALVGALIIAGLLAYILSPLVNIFESFTPLSRRLSATLVYLIFLLGLVAIPSTLAPFLLAQSDTLVDQLNVVNEDINLAIEQIASWLNLDLPTAALPASATELFAFNDNLLAAVGDLSTNLIWVLITIVTTYYLLQDWDKLREWTINLAPVEQQPEVRRLYMEIRTVWSAYVRGQLFLAFLIGLLSGLAAAMLGVRGAWAIGLVAGILDVIPNLGPTLAAVIAAFTAFVSGSATLNVSNFLLTVLILGAFAIIQGIENVWLRPRILGGRLKLHPGVIFIAVMSSLALAGILLTLIIVPLIGTVMVIGRYAHARLLGNEPWPDDVYSMVTPPAVQPSEENYTSQPAD